MLVGRRGLSPVLIGRVSALAGLRSLVRDPGRDGDGGLPAVALIAGEAGVGKTRLLRELVGTLPEGTQVLAAHSEPRSLGRPLDVVRSMLGSSIEGTDDTRTAAVDEIVARVRDRPSIAVFEDLHWADADSVAVFEVLAGMTLPALTLVATYRPEDLTSRLPGGEMLVRLERRRNVYQVHLDRLDRHEIASFLAAVYGRPVGTAVVDSLRRRTGGNPFFLEEILAAAADVEPDALADQPLPWSLSELVSRQLDGLSSDERRVVEAAAVLGARARFDVLATLSRRSEDELIDNLRALVERGLLVEADNDEFTFRNELVRDAVEHQLLGRERRRLHEQALDVLSQSRCTDLADLAHHAAGAGRYDEMVDLAREGVVHYLDVGSTHQALHLAVAALAESPDDHDLLAGAARAAWLIGADDEAWSHVEQLLDVTAGQPAEQRSPAIRLAARIAHERQDHDRMWALIGELERISGELEPGEERALSMAAIAQIDMLNRRPTDAVEWAERAAKEAEQVGAKAVLAQAMVERATALTDIAERRADGVAALFEATDEAERVEDWVLVARALNNLANVAPLADRRALLERMRQAGRRAGFDSMAAANYYVRVAELAFFEGDADGALHHCLRVGDFVGAKAHDSATQLRITLLLEGNRPDEAAELLAIWDRTPPSGEKDVYPASCRVMLAARRGNRTAADKAFAQLTGQPGCGIADTANAFLFTVEAALASGTAASDVVAAAATWGFATKSPELAGVFDAFVAAAAADHAAVIRLLDGQIDDVAGDLPAALRAALGTMLARALAAQSRTADARSVAAAASALLDRWPGWRRDDLDALLHRLDAASTTVEGELTRREREVAALLAEGLSNSEVARRLFISPKTAAVHVSNILMKLGMANRAEVAAWAVRNNVGQVAT